jgi:hypothetical protein
MAPTKSFNRHSPAGQSLPVVAQKSIRSWNRIVREDWDRRLFVRQMKHGPQLTAMHGFRSALHSTEAVTEQNDLSRRNRRVCAATAEFTQRDVRSDDADLCVPKTSSGLIS